MKFLRIAVLQSLALGTLVHAAEMPAPATGAATASEAPKPSRASIVGKIIDAAGKPVEGVTVFVYEGWPKKEDYNYCPTCFPDCGKQCVTDVSGAFHLDDL